MSGTHTWRGALVALLVLAASYPARPAAAEPPVDLALVLAVDVSLSMDLDEQRLQRGGYVAGLRDPAVWQAIRAGETGRIALMYVEWAGAGTQTTVIPWTLIDGPAAAQAFADRLERQPISRARMTSIAAALAYAAEALADVPFPTRRRVVDVSGDGPNNSGPPVAAIRDRLVAQGIVINGLPILLKRAAGAYSYFDIDDLDGYYAACVIGGPGAFTIPVRRIEDLVPAIRRKLVLEISGLPARVIRTQAPSGQAPSGPAGAGHDCLVGEKRWQDYLRDRLHE